MLKMILKGKTKDEAQQIIMKKFGLASEAAYRDKIEQTMSLLNTTEPAAIRSLIEARTRTGAKQ